LFNEIVGLWRHDVRHPEFSSRANGEAFSGLAKVLDALPSTDHRRAELPARIPEDGGHHPMDAARDASGTVISSILECAGPESAAPRF